MDDETTREVRRLLECASDATGEAHYAHAAALAQRAQAYALLAIIERLNKLTVQLLPAANLETGGQAWTADGERDVEPVCYPLRPDGELPF
jgi:hypothetical protein